MKKTSLLEDVFGSLHKSRMRLLLPVIALVLLIGIGVFNKSSPFAWNVHEMSIQNNLDSRTDSVQITENFPNSSATGTRTKKVTFRNTGSVAAFVRMASSESWEIL